MVITSKIICAAIVSNATLFSSSGATRACRYSKVVIKASKKYNLDPYLLTALIKVESNWKPHVVSSAGACGLTQVLHKYSKYNCEQLKNPKTSILEGAKKLNFWIYKYGKGDLKTGLCGYNAGFRCKGSNPNKKGLTYTKKVVTICNMLKRRK
jgi:soluble lytic murein transglycosylase-like protein|tara:strand:- start:1125 stop:1583 length:459 start_codon:yes stop_codon:yes gene_type:complete